MICLFCVLLTPRRVGCNVAALCVGGADEARSVLDQRGWKEGEHFHRVETTLVCHDGESIQVRIQGLIVLSIITTLQMLVALVTRLKVTSNVTGNLSM